MADPIRIPLVETVEPRLADSNKDGLASNIFYDKQQDGKVFATKRPGITSYISASGQAGGIFDTAYINYADRIWTGNVWTGSYFFVSDTVNAGHWMKSRVGKSTDGINWTWTIVPTSGEILASNLAWNGSVLLLADFNSTTGYTSPDGETWTTITLPATGTFTVSGTPETGKLFLTTNTSLYVSSNNGSTWTLCSFSGVSSVPSGMYVVYNASSGKYCAAGGAGHAYIGYSSDAINFTSIYVDNPNSIYNITSTGSRFVAVDGTGVYGYYSSDAISWTKVSTGFSGASLAFSLICWDGTKVIATNQGQGDITILTTVDGSVWTDTTFDDPVPYEFFYPWAISSNGTTDVITCYTSSDGVYLYLSDGSSTLTKSNLNPPASQDFYITVGNVTFP